MFHKRPISAPRGPKIPFTNSAMHIAMETGRVVVGPVHQLSLRPLHHEGEQGVGGVWRECVERRADEVCGAVEQVGEQGAPLELGLVADEADAYAALRLQVGKEERC